MEGVSEWDVPPNLSDEYSPRPDRFSDADVGDSSPPSSNYSSCDGSDFDRYCSANSVLGSASVCSSVGNYSGIGEEFPLDVYRSRGKFLRGPLNEYECLSDGGAETPRANGSFESPLTRPSTSSMLIDGPDESLSSCYGICGGVNTKNLLLPCLAKGKGKCSYQGASGDEYSEKYEEKVSLNEDLWNIQNGTQLDLHNGSAIKLENNEDVFSQSKLSENEDSMLEYGTVNEGIIQFCETSFQLFEETKHEDLNPLFTSSSVAFGTNDWDEFVQGGGLASASLHQDQSFQHQDKHIGRDFEEKLEGMAVTSFEGENLTVKDVEDSNYVSEINHEEQVVDIHTRIRGSRYSALNSHEAGAVDPTIKKSEYVSFTGLQNILSEDNEVKFYLNFRYDSIERKNQLSHVEGDAGKGALENKLKDESDLPVNTLYSNSVPLQYYHSLNGVGGEIKRHELDKHSCLLPLSNNGDGSSIQRVDRNDPRAPHLAKSDIEESEVKKLDTGDSYDEMVLEMEEILLDSGKRHGSKHMQANQRYISQPSHHFGDGSSIASTSAMDDIYPVVQVPSKIYRVEVIGAKQKKGDVSFGERLVGVREYTIYQMKVGSGSDEWKVERRYRDFFALYCQLKAFFTGRGLSLPSAWSGVEQESRKIFGNVSPNVILERSILIEDCLCSILNARFPFETPGPLIMFLTPGKSMFKSGLLQSLVPQYLQKFAEDENSDCGEARPEDASLLGQTISLVVEIKPHKSLRQLLEIQHYTCAGCHRRLDAGNTLFRELVQIFWWNRPRFCEYTGQLFCASCHTNDNSVLPARVLHNWDFTLHPVSQFAKAYLESIYDQPMLCVSAVNPFLFSKVPALLHVMDFRKKIGAMLPYLNCPFRSSIQKNLGFRRHLLESNDFFALRDLVDLSKGPFAALPVMVENISNLILEHITQQCLVCYDSGVPCAARQACHDPSSLIFPFQEAEAEKCTSCGSIFHKACFVNLLGCSCCNPDAITKRFNPTEPSMMESHRGSVLERAILPLVTNSATGFFTNIFTRAKSDKILKPKNSSPVILMGSLPSSL